LFLDITGVLDARLRGHDGKSDALVITSFLNPACAFMHDPGISPRICLLEFSTSWINSVAIIKLTLLKIIM
jgi:hypothetical protein